MCEAAVHTPPRTELLSIRTEEGLGEQRHFRQARRSAARGARLMPWCRWVRGMSTGRLTRSDDTACWNDDLRRLLGRSSVWLHDLGRRSARCSPSRRIGKLPLTLQSVGVGPDGLLPTASRTACATISIFPPRHECTSLGNEVQLSQLRETIPRILKQGRTGLQQLDCICGELREPSAR